MLEEKSGRIYIYISTFERVDRCILLSLLFNPLLTKFTLDNFHLDPACLLRLTHPSFSSSFIFSTFRNEKGRFAVGMMPWRGLEEDKHIGPEMRGGKIRNVALKVKRCDRGLDISVIYLCLIENFWIASILTPSPLATARLKRWGGG